MNDDTSKIECILVRFRPAGPDADLRSRVVQRTRTRSRWAFAEAMAAMLLIGLNLAQIGASVTQIIPPPHTNEARTRQLAVAIARLDLPFSQDEAYAMAQQLSAGERLVRLPLVHGSPSMNINNGGMP